MPPVYCLNAREGKFREYNLWQKEVERPLRYLLHQAAMKVGMQPDEIFKFTESATEQEIAQGVFNSPDARDNVFCFFRKIISKRNKALAEDLPPDKKSRDFIDLLESGQLDTEAYNFLQELKEKLNHHLPVGNIHIYPATWTGNGITTDHIGDLPEKLEDCLRLNDNPNMPQTLCVDVWRRLSGVILKEIAQIENIDALDEEIAYHAEFGMDRTPFFIGRTDILDTIDSYIRGTDHHPMIVYGASGSGKTALMAKTIQSLKKKTSCFEYIFRFIGATPESSVIRSLLESLCRQLYRCYARNEYTFPSEFNDLVQDFFKGLALASKEKPLVIFLDALDQLTKKDNAQALNWMPIKLPPHVRMVVSILDWEGNGSECLQSARDKLPPSNFIELKGLTQTQGKILLESWLRELDSKCPRQLQPHQMIEVLNKFTNCPMPLYLKLAFEEARHWKSYTPPEETILSQNIPGIISDLFKRLSLETNHGEVLLSRCLGRLVAAREGLTEDELIDVLSADKDVMISFKQRSPESPEIDRLPVIVWSRLYFDLEAYLTERSADNTSLFTFYHQQISKVISDLTKEHQCLFHQSLADYFQSQPHPLIDAEGKQATNHRKITELPWQLQQAGQWAQLKNCLINPKMFEALDERDRYELLGYWKVIEGLYDIATEYKRRAWKVGKNNLKFQFLGVKRIESYYITPG